MIIENGQKFALLTNVFHSSCFYTCLRRLLVIYACNYLVRMVYIWYPFVDDSFTMFFFSDNQFILLSRSKYVRGLFIN